MQQAQPTKSSQTILQEALGFIADDTKFIRIATITTFVHSLSFVVVILMNIYNIIQTNQETGTRFSTLLENYFSILLPSIPPTYILILGAIILFFGYVILPPIGEGAMISYLHTNKNKGKISLTAGINRFFPMFEFNAGISLFSLFVFLTTISRLRILWILDQPLIISILLILLFLILLVSFLLAYTRYYIMTEELWLYDAMKKSMHLSIENLFVTVKYVAITYVLYLRLVLNLILFVGVPLGMIYIVNLLGVDSVSGVGIGMMLVIIALICIVAYINGIVEAFFTTYWYKVFASITKPTQTSQPAQLAQDTNTV